MLVSIAVGRRMVKVVDPGWSVVVRSVDAEVDYVVVAATGDVVDRLRWRLEVHRTRNVPVGPASMSENEQSRSTSGRDEP